MTNRHGSYDQGYTDYQVNRGVVRKFVRGFYLRSAARMVSGPTIDFGCGVGELLQALPQGSTGLEINPSTVAYCRHRGLDVVLYDAGLDGWGLGPVVGSGRRYRSLVISHVLEHLDLPMQKLNALLMAAKQVGVERALVIVPGKAGFASDVTHVTFVDEVMLRSDTAVQGTGFHLAESRWYPLGFRAIGDVFLYNELRALYVLDHDAVDADA